jgi:hypothetical protein
VSLKSISFKHLPKGDILSQNITGYLKLLNIREKPNPLLPLKNKNCRKLIVWGKIPGFLLGCLVCFGTLLRPQLEKPGWEQ